MSQLLCKRDGLHAHLSSQVQKTKEERQRKVHKLAKSSKSLTNLENYLASFWHHVSDASRDIILATENLKECQRSYKVSENSLHSRFEFVLKSHDVWHAAHHGGDFISVHVEKIALKADPIMYQQLCCFLCDAHPNKREMAEHTWSNICTLLIRWGKVFSLARKEDPTAKDFDLNHTNINEAVRQMKQMGMSETPKVHRMQWHLVDQIGLYRKNPDESIWSVLPPLVGQTECDSLILLIEL